MTPERWKRIDELVQGALDLPPEDRAAFVDSQCGGDAGLRSVVASLISHQGNMSGLPGSPAIEDAAASMEEGGVRVGLVDGQFIVNRGVTSDRGEDGGPVEGGAGSVTSRDRASEPILACCTSSIRASTV